MRSIPLIVMAGRTNVGKSTLFNRLTESAIAITSPLPGTTRDVRQQIISWRDRLFYLCDLAGLEHRARSTIDQTIQRKTQEQLKAADLLLFIVDGQAGMLPDDWAILRSLRKLRHRPPILLTINKLDNPRYRKRVSEDFLRTGCDSQIMVSALNGSGTGDLLDDIVKRLPKATPPEIPKQALRIALIGRPNVGKSSIVNALAAEERVLVHPEPHTTRDAIDVPIRFRGDWFWIIDTAGIRRPSRVGSSSAVKEERRPLSAIEKASIAQSLRAAHRADIIALVLDLTAPLSHQDLRLVSTVMDEHKPTILVLNKWDEVKPGASEASDAAQHLRGQIIQHLERQIGPIAWMPVVMMSALANQHVTDLLKCSQTIYNNLSNITDEDLQLAFTHFKRWLERKHPRLAPSVLRLIKNSDRPLTFRIKMKSGTIMPEALLRTLERTLREHLSLTGVPMLFTTKTPR